MWLIVEAIFILMLTPDQFKSFFISRQGVWELMKFMPVRFMLWPFLLVAMAVEIIEAIQDINRLHVWWFDEENFKP